MSSRSSKIARFILPVLISSALLTILPLFSGSNTITGQCQAMPSVASAPNGTIQLSTYQVYRGQTLTWNITVGDQAWSLPFMNWSFAVQNYSTSELDWVNVTGTEQLSPNMNGTWVTDSNTYAGEYRVWLGIKNGNDEATNVTQSFEVCNNLPVIHAISANMTVVLRGQSFNVTVNATDVEIANLAPYNGEAPDTNIYVQIWYRDTTGATGYENAIKITNTNYTAAFDDFDESAPLGSYTFWAVIEDYRPGFEAEMSDPATSVTIGIRMSNNKPSITVSTQVLINDLNPASTAISVTQGNSLKVTVSVTDYENTVRFVRVSLIHENGNWRNYTIDYAFSHTITIDTEEFETGTWALYLRAIDADGDFNDPAPVISIEITVAAWEIAAPILFFLIGITVGIGIGVLLYIGLSKRNATKEVAGRPAEDVTPIEEKTHKAPAPATPKKPVVKEEKHTATPEEAEGETGDTTQMKRKMRRRIE